ncbi:hypothetical protein H0A36_01105 [Endozoicomonas sp. SM1973]|uniref:Pyrrolidone-carboxylate peptidase n=1 Tax=Spartinivicinus marinus TaxID=2994442 RepID=A0A853I5T5_9GAMM|nr:hypothetical protein [Spartinivicinus marinus]MCX4026751.1 hypothetical protein [Spartinivicinus marinus]NYZ64585.1 hypothetical protein [Spartinivicinus marinus]
MKGFISTLLTGLSLLVPMAYSNQSSTNNENSPYTAISPTIEEQRLPIIQANLPELLAPHQLLINQVSRDIESIESYKHLVKLAKSTGQQLWQIANKPSPSVKDDRPLYWARLAISKIIRQQAKNLSLTASQQESLFWQYELASRGQLDVNFKASDQLRILITGFDPFFLDYNIEQSNPSGSIALTLDGKKMTINGQQVAIEAFILPVRFEDFDRGMVETLLTPYIANPLVDIVATISMGRSNFDLERFPGLRRSAQAPDNLNIYTGASAANPLVPLLKGSLLDGAEFVEFSLPAKVMKKATGRYQINDNHKVITTQGVRFPNSLMELTSMTSVEGSGGGYLSNEISYRSIRLRNRYQPLLPVGHIHTPRVSKFNKTKQSAIIQQVKQMLMLAADVI